MKKLIFGGMALFFMLLGPVYAHRDGCHRWHSCPSDTGSYTCGDLGYTTYCGTSPSTPAAAPAAATTTAVRQVTATLNLRQQPSTSARIVARITKGVSVNVLGCNPSWCQIKVQGYTGYVSRAYLK